MVLAGLVPNFQAGAIEGSERWPIVILRPGDDPLKNLAAAVVQRFLPTAGLPNATQVLKLIDDLRANKRKLLTSSPKSVFRDQPEDVRVAVVVDQFEEVFTYRPQNDQARARFEQTEPGFRQPVAGGGHARGASGRGPDNAVGLLEHCAVPAAQRRA